MTGWRGALLWKRLWKELAKQLRAELAIARSSLDTVERERESRITALTAELAEKTALLTAETMAFAEMRAKSRADYEAAVAVSDAMILGLGKALATERAAREKAEKHREEDLASFIRTNQACVLERDAEEERADQAERERDTALARVKEWEQAYDSNGFGPQNPSEVQVFLRERDRVNGQVAALRVSAAESALASARELSTERYQELCRQAQRAADAETALEGAHMTATKHPNEQTGFEIAREIAAARRHPAPVAVLPPISGSDEAIVGALIDARTPPSKPMPAPVAAPERGTRDVVETAIDLTKDDKHSRWNALMARTAELPVTVMATSEYPSPAPCSGCAAARELLGQALMVLVHWNNYQAEEGRSYIPEDENAAVLLRIQAWLKERP